MTNARNGLPAPLVSPGDNHDKSTDISMAEQRVRPDSQTQADNNSSKLQNGQTKPMSASNAKDPLRPRRKKAKRACFACQRAHLTCGDERPCQRCIKRGIQNACHDGVRKKAKYLHDAPNEALMPHLQGQLYNQANAVSNNIPLTCNGSDSKTNFVPPQNNNFNDFYQNKQDGTLNQSQLHDTGRPDTFPSQSPVSPTFNMAANPAATGNTSLSSSIPPSNGNASNQAQNGFASTFFDPGDPALFNFDLASMNFGNHYGALEFGMLGHMATGAGETPPSDNTTQHGSVGRSGSGTFTTGSNFGESPTAQSSFLFGDPAIGGDWSSSVNTRNLYGQNMNNMSETPHAFAIESAPANFASPNSIESPLLTTSTAFDDNNTCSAYPNRSNMSSLPPQRQPVVSTPQLKHLHIGKRRQRNPTAIYESVKEPYSYTTGFHSLTAFIQRRFTPQNTLRIAKALASIRPSFIATTKTLNRDDLIFMEKCFQRTLWEYEDFINACGTPTIVCRRTGEIAAVGKEFSILTGWKKEVLLGKEPNLNINVGGSSEVTSRTSSRGSFTPRAGIEINSTGRTQPVFLAELLDDESVVEFYEDFAKLAFGDSRGSVTTTCKLLKYKTKADMDMLPGTTSGAGCGANETGIAGSGNIKSEHGGAAESHQVQQMPQRQRRWSKGGIAGEAGMNQLGFKDGKVECSYCWTVKRDVFDIPMLIVMNGLWDIG
ncbi:Transcriptional regulator of nonfermentable carbon utilization [Emydomyces testavorans]|uniref:Transcriptional regulator of nonfermentable carbon utilization n=1 Tax=Emydomyces testavorans TaxID=2070801 RepID=A0AAF0DIY4_9EURO|nr:Transcriptional regulator of nonfermentable carbon utilization [Emydomyces testavorans]